LQLRSCPDLAVRLFEILLAAPADAKSGIRVATNRLHHIYPLGGFVDSAVGDLRVLENGRRRRIGAIPSNATAGELGFVFDAARDRFVAFGSSASSARATAEVWECDGTRWIKSGATPPPVRLAMRWYTMLDAGGRSCPEGWARDATNSALRCSATSGSWPPS
jgi:hypothetical protein